MSVLVPKGRALLVPVFTSKSNCGLGKNQHPGDIAGKWQSIHRLRGNKYSTTGWKKVL